MQLKQSHCFHSSCRRKYFFVIITFSLLESLCHQPCLLSFNLTICFHFNLVHPLHINCFVSFWKISELQCIVFLNRHQFFIHGLAIWGVEWYLQVSRVLNLQEKQSEPILHCHQLNHQDLLRNLEGVQVVVASFLVAPS